MRRRTRHGVKAAGSWASTLLFGALALGCGSGDTQRNGSGGASGGGNVQAGTSGGGTEAGRAGTTNGGSANGGSANGGSANGGAATHAGGATHGAGTNGNAGRTTNGGKTAAGGSGAGRDGTSGSGLGGASATAGDGGASGATDGGSQPWVYGYWAVWQATEYPLEHVAWRDLTHAALSFVLPRASTAPSSDNPYATLDTSNVFENLGPDGFTTFARAAHGGGTRPLISLGGAGAGVGFAAAASAANRAQFIADILSACEAWGYDGVDLDWEDSINGSDFLGFVKDLRAAAPRDFLITVPVGSVNLNLGIDADTTALWSAGHPYVDQLNVMTYTGSGAYPGWVVWYLDALQGHGSDHPVDVASSLAAWSALGIPKSKLGVGIGFYGRAVSAPVTAALQAYGSAQVYEDDSKLSYGNIVRYFEHQGGAVATWDDSAQTTALSWPAEFHPAWTDQYPGDAGPPTQFLTYEDSATVQAKGAWVKANGYGGTIIWTINEGVQFPYGADGYDNPLLDATSAAFH